MLGGLYGAAFFASIAYDPSSISAWPSPGTRYRLFAALAEHADPRIRVPFDIAMAALFAAMGIDGAFVTLWSARCLFNLDRWKPPIEDRTHISKINER